MGARQSQFGGFQRAVSQMWEDGRLPRLGLAISDAVSVGVSMLLATEMQYNGAVPPTEWEALGFAIPITAIVLVCANSAFGLYHRVWRYTGPEAAATIAASVTITFVVSGIGMRHLTAPLPTLIWYSAGMAVLSWVGGLRLAWRLIRLQLLYSNEVEKSAHLHEQVALAEYRERLSQEMHDGIQYYLVNIASRLELAKMLAKKDPAEAARLATDQTVLVQQASDELRYLIKRLRSPIIEREGLVQALREQVERLKDRSGVDAQFEVDGAVPPLQPDAEHAAFRIVQEALTNVEKHAKASKVTVRLEFHSEALQCEVIDDGAGFDVADPLQSAEARGRFGLSGMRERLRSVAGELHIRSAPGEGTTVAFRVPLADPDSPGSNHASGPQERL